MDRMIKKIEKDVKGGKKKAAEKDLKHLEKADKKRDKVCEMGKMAMEKHHKKKK